MWLLWASPDCRHHSKARGSKPVSKRVRGLPWAIVRAAMTARPDSIMFENVEEIQDWGPCIVRHDGKEAPDPERKGETFKGFISIMTSGITPEHPALSECCEFLDISLHSEDAQKLINGLGYEFEGKELVAADYGVPTIRKRFYSVFRCDGNPIIWPEPTHSKNGEGGKLRWRTAAEIIDWFLPCPSIFESKEKIKEKYGLTAVRPLAENTQRRIIRGVDAYTIKDSKPFIVPEGYAPFTRSNTSNSVGADISEPLNTVRTSGGGGQMLIASNLIQYHTEQTENFRGQGLEAPLQTVDTSNRYGLSCANLIEYFGNGRPLDVREPLHTVTTKDRDALTLAHIQKYFGGVVGADIEAPLPTVTTVDHNALCTTRVEKYSDRVDLKYWPQVRALLNKYCGYTLDDDEVLLLNIRDSWYFIADIGLRMLVPRELYNAHDFPPDYCIEFSVNGKPYSRGEQVSRCGNSVCPPMSEALVRANFPERCVGYINSMAELERAMAV